MASMFNYNTLFVTKQNKLVKIKVFIGFPVQAILFMFIFGWNITHDNIFNWYHNWHNIDQAISVQVYFRN